MFISHNSESSINVSTTITPVKEDKPIFKILFCCAVLMEWCYMGTMLIIVVTQYIKIKYPFRVIRTSYIITISAVIGLLYITSLSLYFILGKVVFLPGFQFYIFTTSSLFFRYVISTTLFIPSNITMVLINLIAGMTWWELYKHRKNCVQDESKLRILKGTNKILIMGFSCDICTITFAYYMASTEVFLKSQYYTASSEKISPSVFRMCSTVMSCYIIPLNTYCIYNTMIYLLM